MAADTLFRRITDYANRADPYPLYAELREHGVARQDDGSLPPPQHGPARGDVTRHARFAYCQRRRRRTTLNYIRMPKGG